MNKKLINKLVTLILYIPIAVVAIPLVVYLGLHNRITGKKRSIKIEVK